LIVTISDIGNDEQQDLTFVRVLLPDPFFPMIACTYHHTETETSTVNTQTFTGSITEPLTRTSPSRMVRSTPLRICCPVSLTEAVSPCTSRRSFPAGSAAAAEAAGGQRLGRTEMELSGSWRRMKGRDEEGEKREGWEETAAAAKGGAMGRSGTGREEAGGARLP
jgi:hypothetical protein